MEYPKSVWAIAIADRLSILHPFPMQFPKTSGIPDAPFGAPLVARETSKKNKISKYIHLV